MLHLEAYNTDRNSVKVSLTEIITRHFEMIQRLFSVGGAFSSGL
jgi:hypothetical protein